MKKCATKSFLTSSRDTVRIPYLLLGHETVLTELIAGNMSCENFARDADLKDDGPSNEGAILKMVFNTISSRKTLFRVMRCNAIPCNPSDSLKQLRHILNRRIRFLDKQNASTSRLHEHRQTLCVTNPNANGPNGCRQYLRH